MLVSEQFKDFYSKNSGMLTFTKAKNNAYLELLD
jgi:hypothetical protein